MKRPGDKKAAAFVASKKLPILAETVFRRKHVVKNSSIDENAGIFIDRIYAKGGFVMVEYTDIKKNKSGQKMMTPSEAAHRAATLLKAPREMVQEGLVEATTNAAMAARGQTLDGGNPLFELNKKDDTVQSMMVTLVSEIEGERKKDPELDDEMKRIEKQMGMTLSQASKDTVSFDKMLKVLRA